jgi:hypothetical protein
MCDIFMLGKKNGDVTGYRMFFIGLVFLLTGMLMGCNTDDESGDKEDDTPASGWFLTSIYYYDYDSDDQLSIETNDNNANDSRDTGDVTWYYEYDADGLRSGYYMYEGSIGLNPDPNVDADGVGTYFYNTNGCNDRLEEETLQGADLQVWTFDVDSECNRLSYTYDGNDTDETGTYYRDGDGNVIELRLDSKDYWEYTLDINGDRLRYDFYQDDTRVRYGIYSYADDRLDVLRNYEKR